MFWIDAYDRQIAVLDESMFFFFSSRRRHTRLQGDWSSDVCSSDLVRVARFLETGRLELADGDLPARDLLGIYEAARDLRRADRAVRIDFGVIFHERSEEGRVGKEGRSRWSPDH